MAEYIAVQTREIRITAQSASDARILATAAFDGSLSPADIKSGLNVSSITNMKIHVEKIGR